MSHEIRTYRKPDGGERVLEIHGLDFISDRNHKYGWLGLHIRHFRIKILLKWADKVYVPSCDVAIDLVKYYFYPRENIVVDRAILSSDKV